MHAFKDIQQIHITGVEHLDPVDVYVEDFPPQGSRIIIRCYDGIWQSFWGGCGGDGKKFFLSCDDDYLLKNFIRSGQLWRSDVVKTVDALKRRVIEMRTHDDISKTMARALRNELEEHRYDDLEDFTAWCNTESHEFFNAWWEDIQVSYTSDAIWLKDKIFPEIRKVFEKMVADKEALAGLQKKYPKTKFKHPPNPDCKFCKGTGEKKRKNSEEMTFCICTFVDHDFSDIAGAELGKFAKKMRKELQDD